MHQALLRLPEVAKRTGLSRSEIYRREALGEFPRRVNLGARSVAWPEFGPGSVQEWIEARIRASRERQSAQSNCSQAA